MAENSPPLKEMVMKHFIEDDSTTRIIFCTEAFGMGLDCPNITQVIHYSPSQTAEGYIQEIGRGGRNGQQAVALCIHTPTSAPINKDMKQYVRAEDKCRRRILFEDTLKTTVNRPITKCRCCDVCMLQCTCGQCVQLNYIES
jgi:ATP-dependent DNA helicase RecQ